ncbi:MAG: glutaredoxin family protein [Xanthomonadales bacterium]|jgi:glutaredoxin|nr:glutaredoxin family protein [Xanthomonadales bacterium]
MSQVILYSRPDCHLCEEAGDLLSRVAPERAVRVVDIEDDITLIDRYGIRVPVLRLEASGEELGWPFDEADLARFLDAG